MPNDEMPVKRYYSNDMSRKVAKGRCTSPLRWLRASPPRISPVQDPAERECVQALSCPLEISTLATASSTVAINDASRSLTSAFYEDDPGVARLTRLASSDTIGSMIDWSSCAAVERDPERVSGAWIFRGTRIPVAALFENLEDGASATQFVEWFPGVTLEQVRIVLDHAARSALAPA